MPTTVEVQCSVCSKKFFKSLKRFNEANKQGWPFYCSKECFQTKQKTALMLRCGFCGTHVVRRLAEFNKSKSKYAFCSKSCAAKYNNAHKKRGTRRAKLEVYLEEELNKLYPNIQIEYNNKKAINSELDIYLPSLKLAFELNGIFHYEPIYGEEKLKAIQNNDCRKFQACLEQGIELCIIDTHNQTHVSKTTSKKYLDIIVSILNTKIKSLSLSATVYNGICDDSMSPPL